MAMNKTYPLKGVYVCRFRVEMDTDETTIEEINRLALELNPDMELYSDDELIFHRERMSRLDDGRVYLVLLRRKEILK